MGRLLLIARLAVRDLRRRPFDAVMVVLVIGAAVTALSAGLALRGVTDDPYRHTRESTAGPDVVASFLFLDNRTVDPAVVEAIAGAPGVVAHSGPFPLAYTRIEAHGKGMGVTAEGRDAAPAAVDRPLLTSGGWIASGEVVVERGFADAFGIRAGETVTVGGRAYRVAGTAVTAGLPSYPSNICHIACNWPFAPATNGGAPDVGLVWLPTAEVTALGRDTAPLSWYLNLKLADPTAAPAFVDAQRTRPDAGGAPGAYLIPWTGIRDADNGLIQTEQVAMQVGGLLLALLAIAGVAVLASRRMLDQTHRVGLLKAIGGTPGLVAAVLLAEHLTMALAAAALGIGAGRQLTPSLTTAGAGLVGAPGAPALTASTVALPVALAIAVAVAATLLPALRAARTSTVRALNDPTRPPRRRPWLVAISGRLPVMLLLGLRLIGRRPTRGILNALSVTVTVTGIVAIFASAGENLAAAPGPRAERLGHLTVTITVMLIVVAAVNTLFSAWATITDARRMTALSRAFGATSWQVGAGLSAAQLLPATGGALLGIPLGLYLYRAAAQQQMLTVPPAWELAAILLGTLTAVVVLTAVPWRLTGRRSLSEALQSERT